MAIPCVFSSVSGVAAEISFLKTESKKLRNITEDKIEFTLDDMDLCIDDNSDNRGMVHSDSYSSISSLDSNSTHCSWSSSSLYTLISDDAHDWNNADMDAANSGDLESEQSKYEKEFQSRFEAQMCSKRVIKRAQFNDLLRNESILMRIADFMPRLQHFTTLCRVSVDCNRLFSIQRYFSASQPLITDLFRRDTHYFQNEIKPLFFRRTNRASIPASQISTNDGSAPIIIRIFGPQFENREASAMLKFYLIFYDRFVKMQQRYNRQLFVRQRQPLPLSRDAVFASAEETNRYSPNITVFPNAVKTVAVSKQMKTFGKDQTRWISDFFKHSSGASPFTEWDISNCGLKNDDLQTIAKTILSRNDMCSLTHISVARNTAVGDESMWTVFKALGQRCPKIEELNLMRTSIGDHSCVIAAQYFTAYIDLSALARQQKSAQYNAMLARHFGIKGRPMPNDGCVALNVKWTKSGVTKSGERLFAQILGKAAIPSQ